MDFSATVEGGDPWNSPPMSNGPMATITGTGGGESVETTTTESPLSAWLADTRWSRRDLELLTDLIGAIGTLGFLYLALNGGTA